MTNAAGQRQSTEIPSGTVTFLFTDIENSTGLAQQYPAEWSALMERHHAILHQSIQAHRGYVFQIIGDAICAAFHTVPDALDAAIRAQRTLQHESWDPAPVAVRMGIHTGAAQAEELDDQSTRYHGYLTLACAQQIMTSAHGGQVLISSASAELVRGGLSAGVTLLDMGEHNLKGVTNLVHLWQMVADDLRAEFPPLRTLSVLPNNLPVQLTSFIGRESELRESEEKLVDPYCRLLTLVGPGGIGKTRLALQIAVDLLERYIHGVWFVDLSANSEAAQVLVSVADILSIPEVASEPRLKTLKRALRHKQMLLLLDNFEQVIEAAPDLGELLAAVPGLTLVVTSREVLRLQGEHVYSVLPLGLPERQRPLSAADLSHYEAVHLFLDRARSANPAFALTEENAPAVAEVCIRLEGLPLAIELAAARSRLFTPEQLLTQLTNRLRTLVGRERNLPLRQQTIRNTIEWSFQLLDDGEQLLFARLGAFVGGWSLEAAESVCAPGLPTDVLSGLESLLDKSLIRQSQPSIGGTRFTMLETIREFAVEKLTTSEEQQAIHRWHAAYYLEWIRRPEEYWGKFAQNVQALEVENVRAIMRRGQVSGELAAPVEIVCAMYFIWEGRGYAVEMGTWLEEVLADDRSQASLPPSLYARALRITGNLQGLLALDLKKAYRYYEQSLMISRAEQDHRLAAAALSNLAILDSKMGNYALARMHNKEALAFLEGRGSSGLLRTVLGNLAEQLSDEGAYEAAWLFAEKALELAQELDSGGPGVAIVLDIMSLIAIREEKYEAARTYLEQAMPIWDEQQNLYRQTEIWELLGTLALNENNLEAAERLLLQALQAYAERHIRDRVPNNLDRVAELRFAQGKTFEAICIYAAVDTFYNQHGLVRPPVEAPKYEQILASARQQLGEAAFASAWKKGESWELFDLARKLAGE